MNDAASKILTYDQYAQIELQGFTTPYVVELQQAGQHLLFYGATHTSDPKHPQFIDLEDRWKAFNKKAVRPIALVEGGFDEVPQAKTVDRVKSIVDGGEAQFVVHLARRAGIEVVSPEPNRLWEANQLAKEFGRDAVIFYYFIRHVGWWNNSGSKLNIRYEAKKMLERMQKTYNWKDVDFSIKRMTTIHNELFGKQLNWDDIGWINDITTPTYEKYVTNKLARRSGDLRDAYILEQITHYWQMGKSLFVVFGSAHAVRLEPALRFTLTKRGL